MATLKLNTENFFPKIKSTIVGFDDLIDDFSTTLKFGGIQDYPPYNLIKVSENEFLIELAIAGYKKEDILVSLSKNKLSISSKKQDSEQLNENDEINFIHKGISSKSFRKEFNLAHSIEVGDVVIIDGILKIQLINKVEIPEIPEIKTFKIK